MSLSSGTRVGPYRISGAIGAGGMGEVYRATDTRLDRDVAIKVLPESFALDADRVARFVREAKTLAALNHPNIATIYGVEDLAPGGGGHGALVMELVDGEDLSTMILRGPIAVADALPLARQIADALEAAHELGIVHRDLKPANIKVRTDGAVKVLDFGLAKAIDPAETSAAILANSPTVAAQATAHGLIIGTAAYMAPEQAKGRAVDKRADIWAFGVVLYEMLTGRRAFNGEDVSEVLASVLKDEVAWDALPADLPAIGAAVAGAVPRKGSESAPARYRRGAPVARACRRARGDPRRASIVASAARRDRGRRAATGGGCRRRRLCEERRARGGQLRHRP